MAADTPQPASKIWSLAAIAVLAWALIALAVASLAPPSYVPRVFHNYHIEHFAAFYVVAVLSAAALPSVRLYRIAGVLGVLAFGFAAFRILALINKVFYAEDLLCDLAGMLAAFIPLYVGRFRELSAL